MQTISPVERRVQRWAEWVVSHPWLTLLISLVLVGAMAAGGKNLKFSTDYRVYFGQDNPQLLAFDELQNVYARTDNIILMVVPKSGTVFEPRVLEAIREMTRESWTLPYALRVDSITNFQHTEAVGDDLNVAPLLDDGDEISAARIARMREVLLSEPLMVGRLVSATGHVTALNVNFQFPPADRLTQAELPAAVAAARDLRARILAAYPEIERIDLTGSNMMSNAFTEASLHDMQTLVPLMYAVIIVVMALMLRSGWATFATMVVVVISALGAMGLAGWIGIGLTPPSAASPTIITTLAVADSVHIYVTAFMLMRAGRDKLEAIVESVRLNFTAVLLTSVTTTIGFLAVNFTDSPPLKDLANITAMGVMLAWFFSIFTLPALMALLPARVPKAATGREAWLTRLMDGWAELVLARRHLVFWVTLSIGAVFAALAFRNEGNDLFAHYFDERIPYRVETDRVVENLTGLYTLEYSLKCGNSNCISDPDYLAKVEAFAEFWRSQPKTMYVGPITEVFKRLNKNMHGDDPAFFRLPDDRELAAQYLLLYEMSLPFGLDLNNQINQDKSSTRFLAVFEHLKSKETREYEALGRQWLAENAPEMETHGTSPAVMFAYISQRNLQSNFISLPLSLVAISLLMIPLLRTARLGLAFLVPNLVPLAIGFGIWALISGEVNFTMAIVLNMTVGIIVDDSIHFMTKYLRARREQGLQPEAAVRFAFHTVGGALVVTTVVLTAGFMILAQSAFLPNSGMAQLSAITIVSALFIDLLLLPTLLLKLDRENAPTVRPLETPHEALVPR